MITKELIARINALSQKQREFGLTDTEKSEQATLRRRYLDSIKEQVRAHIEPAREPVKPAARCSCGCQGHHRH